MIPVRFLDSWVSLRPELLDSHIEPRICRFLNPVLRSDADPDEEEVQSRVLIHGNAELKLNPWRNPVKGWIEWSDTICLNMEPLLTHSGIYSAILGSRSKISVDINLLRGVLPLFVSKTNSFFFSFGEATLTLEDLYLIGGIPVRGGPLPTDVDDDASKEVLASLKEEYTRLCRSPARKATCSGWATRFKNSRHDHELPAFLSLWLSRHIFFPSSDVIKQEVFPIAVMLSRGHQLSLGPSLLASIYNDLATISHCFQETTNNAMPLLCDAGRLLFLQIWIWERFNSLAPIPHSALLSQEPRIALWKDLKPTSTLTDRQAIKTTSNFSWRPFTRAPNGWELPLFYRDRSELIDSELEDHPELESYVECILPRELLGINGIRSVYYPHRVARQFGFDQDIPVIHSTRGSMTSGAMKATVYFLQPAEYQYGVTARYIQWVTRFLDNRVEQVPKERFAGNGSMVPVVSQEWGRKRKRSSLVPGSSSVEPKKKRDVAIKDADVHQFSSSWNSVILFFKRLFGR